MSIKIMRSLRSGNVSTKQSGDPVIEYGLSNKNQQVVKTSLQKVYDRVIREIDQLLMKNK